MREGGPGVRGMGDRVESTKRAAASGVVSKWYSRIRAVKKITTSKPTKLIKRTFNACDIEPSHLSYLLYLPYLPYRISSNLIYTFQHLSTLSIHLIHVIHHVYLILCLQLYPYHSYFIQRARWHCDRYLFAFRIVGSVPVATFRYVLCLGTYS